MGTGGAGGQLPLVPVEIFQVAVIPLGRVGGPDDLQTAGDGILADTRAEITLPAQTLRFDRCGFRFGTDGSVAACAMRFAEGVPADDQRRGLDIVHGHPTEGLADVHRGGQRIRNTFGAFGIDVDQAHGGGAQRVLQDALAGVAGVGAQPGVFRTPVDVLVRLPTVFPAERETECLESHRIHGVVAGEDHQIGPGQVLAVLLLDGPQQPAGLVQAGVIGPAVDRSETLHAGAGTAAAVLDAVCACRVPRHPHEEGAVVAVVRGPPVLGIRHHRFDIGLELINIDGRHGRGVIEVGVHRIVLGRVLHQQLQVDLVGPPIAVAAPFDRWPDPHWAAAFVFLSHAISFRE